MTFRLCGLLYLAKILPLKTKKGIFIPVECVLFSLISIRHGFIEPSSSQFGKNNLKIAFPLLEYLDDFKRVSTNKLVLI